MLWLLLVLGGWLVYIICLVLCVENEVVVFELVVVYDDVVVVVFMLLVG